MTARRAGALSALTAMLALLLTPALVVAATPVATDDAYLVAEDQTLNRGVGNGVLSNDTDPDGDPLTAQLVSGPTHGTLNLNANGSFMYTPAANFNGPDTFTYEADDGTSSSPPATVTITVTAVNDPPSGTLDTTTISVPEDSGPATDDDRVTAISPGPGESQPVTFTATPANGAMFSSAPAISPTGTLTFTPAANTSGSTSVAVSISDGVTTVALGSFTITFSGDDDPPSGVLDIATMTVGEDSGAASDAGRVTAISPGLGESQPITFTVTPADDSLFSSGPAIGATGTLTFTPAANTSGSTSVAVSISDGVTAVALGSFTITITPVNDPPTALADSYGAAEETTLVVAAPGVLGNDSDIDSTPLTAVLGSAPANGTLTLSPTGGFSYTPDADFIGNDSFTYRARDPSLATSALTTVTISVDNDNDAPVAANDSASTPEDVQLVRSAATGVLVNDDDIDGDGLTAQLVSPPATGSLALQPNGSYTFTPPADGTGPFTFTYRASDGQALSNVATVTMTVTAVNDPPVGNSDAYAPNEDVALVVPAATGVLADDTDVDSATLTAVLVSQPTHGAVALQASGAFSYTPAANYSGPDSFTYRADDGPLQSGITQVTLAVAAVNDPPTFTLGTPPSVSEDSLTATYVGFLNAIDPGPPDESGQNVTIGVLVASPLLFSQQPAISGSGTLTFRPATNRSGTSQVTVTATDDGGTANGGDATGSQTFLITVTGSNDPPIANSDSYGSAPDDDGPQLEAGMATSLNVLANDSTLPDIGEALSIVSATKPLHGTVTIAPGGQGLSYRSAVGYAGNDSFVYTLSDGVFSDTASVLVSVADTLAPALSGPTLRFDTGARLGGSTVAVILGWSAADPGSGVKSYDVEQSTDGGATWTPLFNAATVTSSTPDAGHRRQPAVPLPRARQGQPPERLVGAGDGIAVALPGDDLARHVRRRHLEAADDRQRVGRPHSLCQGQGRHVDVHVHRPRREPGLAARILARQGPDPGRRRACGHSQPLPLVARRQAPRLVAIVDLGRPPCRDRPVTRHERPPALRHRRMDGPQVSAMSVVTRRPTEAS